MGVDQMLADTRAGPMSERVRVGNLFDLDTWSAELRRRVVDVLVGFTRYRCAEHVRHVMGARFFVDLLAEMVTGGKCLRSHFAYLGWLCGAPESAAGLRAAASLELLHVFALVQDDIMDGASLRRGRQSVHLRLAAWQREQGSDGDAARFGESAAMLLGDLCLVWADQLLRDSGVDAAGVARAWPRYDALRSELAVGQLADLLNDAQRHPSLDEVLDVARRKSGNYTVRRPLELGASLAGCPDRVLSVLGRYGELVGEAYQLRDDLLGVFGHPDVTGKPSGGDLAERKATSVVVLAQQMATPVQRARLAALVEQQRLSEVDVEEWRRLIETTGARAAAEHMITTRVRSACAELADGGLDGLVTAALCQAARCCADRVC